MLGVPIFTWHRINSHCHILSMYASSDCLQIIMGSKLRDGREVYWKATGYWLVEEVSRLNLGTNWISIIQNSGVSTVEGVWMYWNLWRYDLDHCYYSYLPLRGVHKAGFHCNWWGRYFKYRIHICGYFCQKKILPKYAHLRKFYHANFFVLIAIAKLDHQTAKFLPIDNKY